MNCFECERLGYRTAVQTNRTRAPLVILVVTGTISTLPLILVGSLDVKILIPYAFYPGILTLFVGCFIAIRFSRRQLLGDIQLCSFHIWKAESDHATWDDYKSRYRRYVKLTVPPEKLLGAIMLL